jgi:hypothetical protein
VRARSGGPDAVENAWGGSKAVERSIVSTGLGGGVVGGVAGHDEKIKMIEV